MEETAPSPPQKTSAGKIVAYVGCGCLGLISLCVAGAAIIFFSVFAVIKKSDAYTDSLVLAQSHPEVIAALGEPVEPGLMLSGSINFNNGEGEADLTIPVSGPKGNGSLRIVADKSGGNSGWTYTTRELRLEDGSEPIPLDP